MKKKIIILGATGFIGRNTAVYFANNHDYDVYGTYFRSEKTEINNVSMCQADLTNKDDVNRVVKGMDIVIQAAAVTSGIKDVADNPHAFISDNAVMNSLILRASFDHNVAHTILMSCTVMYQSSELPVKETDFNANDEMYPSYFGGAWNKVYFEKICEFYSRLGRGKFTALRHSNIYGPEDKFDLQRAHVFGATLTKVLLSHGDKIEVWGTGEEKRDLLHVSDLVDAIEQVIIFQKENYEVFNIGSGKSISISELVNKIIELSGKNLKIEYDLSKPSNKTALSLNCEKAKTILKWEPKISLDNGILETISWYKEHLL